MRNVVAKQTIHRSSFRRRLGDATLFICISALLMGRVDSLNAQERPEPSRESELNGPDMHADLQRRIEKLEMEVAELKRLLKENASAAVSRKDGGAASASGEADVVSSGTQANQGNAVPSSLSPDDRKTLDFLRDTTIDVGLDSYYAFNFNHPVGRVNLLRAYDVLSNNFSLNQASVIFEHAPDVSAGRRFGGRVDLQFGQATDTLQGNPANEPRPQIYRNIFQAYGTYIVSVGKGLTVDFGKWGSSLGIEGNYTKDQMNYSRSYYYDFLPFYHMGVRATYPVNERFALTYWLVNGTNQAEATNGFKDELFGFTAKPRKSMTWVVNYYFGQEYPDRVPIAPSSPIPVQPGLSFAAIRPAPDGRLHIFDSYVSCVMSGGATFRINRRS
jgi:hypothetical protein